MGADIPSYVVWDRRRDCKVTSGFPTFATAVDYIYRYGKRSVWFVRLFDEQGLAPRERRGKRRYRIVTPEIQAKITELYTGKRGQQQEIARLLGVSAATVSRATRGTSR